MKRFLLKNAFVTVKNESCNFEQDGFLVKKSILTSRFGLIILTTMINLFLLLG
jgi:hypothetical protein